MDRQLGSLRGSGGVRQKVDIFEIQNLGDIFDVSTSRPYKNTSGNVQ